MKRIALLPIIGLIYSHTMLAQDLPKVIPPSPEASGMTKNVDIPTNNYTGIPNISLPVYTIKTRELSVPISLSYHASGVKVDDIPTWVGLNWSIDYGGVINRTVKGIPDERSSGSYLYHNFFSQNQFSTPLTNNYCVLGNWDVPGVGIVNSDINLIASNKIDGQPDEFSFNFNGYSGKFYFDINGNIVLFSEQNLRIEDPIITYNEIRQWTVVTGDGTKYVFGDNTSSENGIEYSGYGSNEVRFPSAWYITKIISADGSDKINYTYSSPDDGGVIQYKYLKENIASYTTNYVPNPQTFTITIVKRIFPESITFNNAAVRFFRTNNYKEVTGCYALDSIQIWSMGVRKFTYKLSYYEHPRISLGLTPDYKFSLNKLTLSVNSKEYRDLYECTYDSQPLPPRGSYAQDLWGYYNGQSNNTSLIPTVVQENLAINPESTNQSILPCPDDTACWRRELENTDMGLNLNYYYTDFKYLNRITTHIPGHDIDEKTIENANREPDAIKMQAGILMSIKYETGGTSTFEYEPHDFSFFTKEEEKVTKVINHIDEASNDGNGNYDDYTTENLYIKGSQEIDLNFLMILPTGNPSVTANNKVKFEKYNFLTNSYEFYKEYSSVTDWSWDYHYKVWLDKGYYRITVNPESSFGMNCRITYKPGNGYNKTYNVYSDSFENTYAQVDALVAIDDISVAESSEFQINSEDNKKVKIEYAFRSPHNPNVYSANLYGYTSLTIRKKYSPFTEVFHKNFYPCSSCTGDALCEYCGFAVNDCGSNCLNVFSQEGEEILNLETGEYVISFNPRNQTEYGKIKVNYQTYKDRTHAIMIGGNRIKKITMDDGAGNTIEKEFIYKMHDANNNLVKIAKPDGTLTDISCGVLIDYPRLYNLSESNIIYWPGQVEGRTTNPLPGINIFGSSTTPMSTTNGGYIGYREVEIKHKNNGKSIFKYTSSVDYPDINNYSYPYPDPISFDWRRGKILQEMHIDNNGNTILITDYEYSLFIDILNPYQPKDGSITKLIPAIVATPLNSTNPYFSKYAILSDVSIPSKTVKKQVTLSNTISDTEEFFYTYKRLKRTRTYGSNNDVIDNKTYHEEDFSSTIESINLLRNNHIHDIPIKTETLVNGKLTNAKVIEYNESGKPINIYVYEPNGEQSTTHNPTELIPNNFIKRAELTYWPQGQLKNAQKTKDLNTYYLWAYNGSLPVAKIENVDSSIVSNIIGNQICTLRNMTSDSSINNILNQLRSNASMKNATISTYTYDPLFGITSQTDPNGLSTFYTYDNFGRLELIKDFKGNSLKRYDYHYAGQTPTDNFFKYAVTFNAQGGSAVSSQAVTYGSKVSTPATPTKLCYTFVGWYKESSCTNAWSFSTDVVTATTTLYAKWTLNGPYSVTFNAQGGSAVNSVSASCGSTINAPTAPTKSCYTFGGWYKESSCTNAWSFSTDVVTATTTLYAKWTLNGPYSVTFNAQGGSAVNSVSASCGSTISAPTAPTKSCYTFGGWYKESSCTNAWSFSTDAVTAATTLYAKWTLNNYTVTFNSNGSTYSTATVNCGSTVSAPTAPTRSCYTFGGWYKESSCNNAWNVSTDVVTAATTLYSKWTLNNYTVTFNAQGG
ncbi:MAG TPA: hypothetical protein DIW31_01490, partial [Bacteroidales bacterium]|nr:hypothetical protein [Bacteroidales bacterium]